MTVNTALAMRMLYCVFNTALAMRMLYCVFKTFRNIQLQEQQCMCRSFGNVLL